MREPRIEIARPDDLAAAQAFYDFCGYGGAAIEPANIVVLAWHDSEIIGIARLCHEDGFLCLRGMQVHPDCRRSGIGTRVLQRLMQAAGSRPCYCLPYRRLVGFYAQAGFAVVEEGLPPVLVARLANYRQRGLDVVAMFRASPAA